MANRKKQLLDKFQQHLWHDFHMYCERQGFQQNVQDFITYLIDKGHVSDHHIKRFTIMKEFEPTYEQQSHHKTHTVEALADRFSLSERTIWNILKYANGVNQESKS